MLSDLGGTGGAAIAASRLAEGLRRCGHYVGRFCSPGHTPPPLDSADEVVALELSSEWPSRIWTVFKTEAYRRLYQRRWADRIREALAAFRPDVISIQNIHGAAWDIEVVEACLQIAPVVWTLHDMWAITGSCAYAFDCRKFESACDAACPQLGVYPTLPAGLIAESHRRRRALFEQAAGRLALVAPSAWLAGEARKMARGSVPIHTIAYGTPTGVYRPQNADQIRKLLNFENDGKPVLLVSAASLDDPRKGMRTLADALARLNAREFRVLLLGATAKRLLPPGIDAHYLGPVSGDPFLAQVYNAADVLIHPAHADNQPLVVLESLACGRPVVALPSGGVPEMVVEGETGWLARDQSPQALADAITRAIATRGQWPDYSQRCRARAERDFDLESRARRYEELFDSMIAGKTASPARSESQPRLLREDART